MVGCSGYWFSTRLFMTQYDRFLVRTWVFSWFGDCYQKQRKPKIPLDSRSMAFSADDGPPQNEDGSSRERTILPGLVSRTFMWHDGVFGILTHHRILIWAAFHHRHLISRQGRVCVKDNITGGSWQCRFWWRVFTVYPAAAQSYKSLLKWEFITLFRDLYGSRADRSALLGRLPL